MNKSIRLLAGITAVCFAATFAQSTLWTWTGGTDSDWNNTANWLGGAKPAVNAAGSVFGATNTIQINNGTFKPSANVPTFASGMTVATTVPLFVIKSGASLSINTIVTNNVYMGAQNLTQVTVESGGSLTWGGGTNSTYMAYPVGTQAYNINGTFTINTPNLNVGYQSGRVSVVNLDGGTFNFNGTRIYGTRSVNTDFTTGHSQINLNNGSTFWAPAAAFINLEGTTVAGSDPTLVFDIQDVVSSVTAKYGLSFADLVAVQAGLGIYFISSTLGNDKLLAADNGDGTFTVSTAPIFPLKIASVFTDDMVLQRDRVVPVWGTGTAGEAVTVSFAGQTKNTTVDIAGKWRVNLDPLSANSSEQQLIVTGRFRTITCSRILVGDVWLASGQSNMAFLLNQCSNYVLLSIHFLFFLHVFHAAIFISCSVLADDAANTAAATLRPLSVSW